MVIIIADSFSASKTNEVNNQAVVTSIMKQAGQEMT